MVRGFAWGMKLELIGALVLLSSIAAAGEPLPRAIDAPGLAPDLGFVGAERGDGLVMARQVMPASDRIDVAGVRGGVQGVALAQSRIVYLNKNGVTLSP